MRARPSRSRKPVAVIGAMLALDLSLVGTSAAGAAGVSFRHCGTLNGPGARFAILAHHARCRTARRVIAGLFAGRGRPRRVPITGKVDRVLDGWICGSAAGGFSCGKLGPHGTIRPVNPRHLGPIIDAEAVSAPPRPTACGFLWSYFTDVAARGTSCRTAQRVARRYMAAALGRHPRFPRRGLGFRCRRINTGNAGGGWVAQCHKRRAVVYMVPT